MSDDPSAPGSEGAAAATSGVDARPGALRVALRLALVAALVALDLWSKSAVFAWLAPGGAGYPGLVSDTCEHGHGRYLVLGEGFPWLSFMLSYNTGAAFGSFAQWPHLLVGGRVLAALFLTWLVVRTPARRRWFSLALLLVLAGALGNLYDNLFLDYPEGHPWGAVRDFIDVYFPWGWHFPTFNVADSCITVGAVLLLCTGLGGQEERGARAA